MISNQTIDALQKSARSVCARILTQVCRDLTSPAFGCFDRNWWHYKIRDFPSIILQQGAYGLFTGRKFLGDSIPFFSIQGNEDVAEGNFTKLIQGACQFWNERATRRGAFEEYYPWEQGYPPLAFSTLAVAKLALEDAKIARLVLPGMIKAAKQLISRFEKNAANQQIAGLAALGWIKKMEPSLVDPIRFGEIQELALALQDEEGWFQEYGGPDLGYLSVTIDCLWDLFDATGDSVYLERIESAFSFLYPCVSLHSGSVGMHNARNTDYLVPYGLIRLAVGGESELSQKAAAICDLLYMNSTSPHHFLASTDDRYLTHYIGHSVVRAAFLAKSFCSPTQQKEPASVERNQYWPNCGYLIQHGTERSYDCHISGKKGGVFTLIAKDHQATCSDFGWIIQEGTHQYINHWWSDLWDIDFSDNTVFAVSGRLFSHRETMSSPVKHMVLRLLSLSFGSRMIGFLKNQLIFKNEASGKGFRRNIALENSEVIVVDEIYGLLENVEPARAGRSSKRHVASADSFHYEDFALMHGWKRSTSIERVTSSNCWRATSVYQLLPSSRTI